MTPHNEPLHLALSVPHLPRQLFLLTVFQVTSFPPGKVHVFHEENAFSSLQLHHCIVILIKYFRSSNSQLN